MYFKIILFFLAIGNVFVHGFYVTNAYFSDQKIERSIISKNLMIQHKRNQLDSFPESFRVKFSELGHDIETEFVQAPIGTTNEQIKVFYQDQNGIFVQFKSQSSQETKHYKEINGLGTASLVHDANGQFKMIGTILLDNSTSHLVILPYQNSNTKNSRLNMPESHAIFKRNLETIKFDTDFIGDVVKTKSSNSKKRAVNGQPVSLVIEATAVVDKSIRDSFSKYLKTTNQDEIIKAIETYFAYVYAGADQIYQDNFKNDRDLKISLKLTSIRIPNEPTELEWADPQLNANIPDTNNGQKVINAQSSLEKLANYMNGLNLDIAFDVATGFFTQDLWQDKSDWVGGAFSSGVCTDKKYSVIEDHLGFLAIYILAHEIGHSLSLDHDGLVNCLDNDQFIMTSSFKFDTMKNIRKFSPCSMNKLKNYLLDNNAEASNAASCLKNTIPSDADKSQSVNISKAGQIWNANEQCKRVYGPEADFCEEYLNLICSRLYCRKSPDSNQCVSEVPGVEGTDCGGGNVCVKGFCHDPSRQDSNSLSPTQFKINYSIFLIILVISVLYNF